MEPRRGRRVAPPPTQLDDCEVTPHQPITRAETADKPLGAKRSQSSLQFIEDEPEPVTAPRDEPLKQVRVIHPYLVAHNGLAYWPNSVAEVPASVADKWLLNKWVTAE
jgi:hypothetical protein